MEYPNADQVTVLNRTQFLSGARHPAPRARHTEPQPAAGFVPTPLGLIGFAFTVGMSVGMIVL